MTTFIVRNSFLSLVVCFTANATAAEPLRLRVLTYNLHHGAGTDGKLDLERIARVINDAKPDLVALQEVDQNVRRSGEVDQPAELARLTKMHVVFGGNLDLQGGKYGNAILSRFPIAKHENQLLPVIDRGEQRGWLAAEITLPNETSLLLIATHLDFRRDDRERLAAAEVFLKRAAAEADRPALLAGDLNDDPASATLKKLREAWTSANQEPRPTIPVERPTKQIDFILLRPADRWRVVETQVLDEAIASDHRAFLAVLDWLPAAK